MRLLLISVSLFIAMQIAAADFIYDVDFENPPHTNGSSVTIGPDSDTPSHGTGGSSALVDAGLTGFGSQAAHLTGGQLWFNPIGGPVDTGLHLVSFDMALLVEDPLRSTHTDVYFTDGSTWSLSIGFEDPSSVPTIMAGGTAIGSYILGTAYSFDVLFDFDNDLYDVSMNGSTFLDDVALPANASLDTLYAAAIPGSTAEAGLDNFQWQVIPEPSTIMLLAIGALGCLVFRRR